MAHTIEKVIAEAKRKELVSLKDFIIKLIDSHIKDCDTDIRDDKESINYDISRD